MCSPPPVGRTAGAAVGALLAAWRRPRGSGGGHCITTPAGPHPAPIAPSGEGRAPDCLPCPSDNRESLSPLRALRFLACPGPEWTQTHLGQGRCAVLGRLTHFLICGCSGANVLEAGTPLPAAHSVPTAWTACCPLERR